MPRATPDDCRLCSEYCLIDNFLRCIHVLALRLMTCISSYRLCYAVSFTYADQFGRRWFRFARGIINECVRAFTSEFAQAMTYDTTMICTGAML